MQMRHQRRQVAVRRDEIGAHVARMAGGVADAGDARYRGHALDEARERGVAAVRPGAVVGVHVLADQRHLDHARVGEPLHFRDDLLHRPRHFAAARIGHDAESAELVAAFLHGDEGGDAARADGGAARCGEMIELVLDRKFSVDDRLSAAGPREQRRQPVDALRADDEVDRARAPRDLGAFGLRDAAGDRHQHLPAVARRGLFQPAHPAEFRIDLLRRLLADMAGIEDQKVGVLRPRGLREAFRRQGVGHTTGVVDVHLAAERLDIEPARSAHRPSCQGQPLVPVAGAGVTTRRFA